MVSGKLTFISGGVRSGKSSYAEIQLVQAAHKESGRLVYIASGVSSDAEMKQRITQHKLDRANANWTTIEQPIALEKVLPFLRQGDYILWDCVTTWLANELYEGIEAKSPCLESSGCIEDKIARLYTTIDEILSKANQLTIVSNEVFDEPASSYKETTIYTKQLGLIHQTIVQKATTAIELDSGIPIYWKGECVL